MTTYIPSLTLPGFVFASPAASILLPIVVGSAVGYTTNAGRSKEVYRKWKQPPLAPPSWVFGPVWTVLYASMGYAAYRAWTTGHASFDPSKLSHAQHGATLYTIQLGLNFIWTPIFFGLFRPIEGTIDLLALLGTTSYLAYVWHKVDEVASWMLLPYIGWLTFASYLSFGVGYVNDWDLKGARAGDGEPKSK